MMEPFALAIAKNKSGRNAMTSLSLKATLLGAATALAFAGAAYAEPKIEVLHYWTSGGESKAVLELKKEFQAAGGTWVDSPVAGGGGDAAATVLRSRVLAGNPPSVVQMKGPNIKDWAGQGVLNDIDDVAKAENWDNLLPPLIKDVVTYEGKYVAAPVNIHRVNWIWANPDVLKKAGIAMPTTWDEFNAAADKLKAAGITPLAHGGQPWQDATVFETVVLGIGGPDFYHKAFVELDDATLRSDTMVKVFDEMRKLRGYVDEGFSNREWNLATGMVMNGQAAFQIMGDWAKGEFTAAGKKPGVDFLCAPTPGTQGYLLNTDSFVFFTVKGGGPDVVAGQKLFAKLLMGADFQEIFNLYKGSIPARLGVKRDKFDACAIKSMDDLDLSIKNHSLEPSMAHEMATTGAVRGAILDVVTEHFNSDMASAAAATKLADAVAAAK
jgi:glucose/mannose transport system substrate-binding protein